MFEYFKDCFIVWFIGFAPLLGIYLAIPVGFLLKLDPFSIALFSIIGTYLPIPLIIILFDRLNSIPFFRKLIMRFYSPKITNILNRHGMFFIMLTVPFLGAWTVSIGGRLLHLDARRLAVYTLLGMCLFGIVLTLLIQFGLFYINVDEKVLRLFKMG